MFLHTIMMGMNPATIHQALTQKYGKFLEKLMERHADIEKAGKGNRGHGFDHDLLVAHYALAIQEQRETAEASWIASLLHSFDHFYGDAAETEIMAMLEIATTDLTEDTLQDIASAVMLHSTKNDENDSMIKITLQDADRLANIGGIVIIRSGQFRPTIPACEIGRIGVKNPESTYKNPRSILDDLRNCLSWESDPRFLIRLPKAIEIAKPQFAYLRAFLAHVESQFREIGLS